MPYQHIFALPIDQNFLLYAPLSATAVLLNRAALAQVCDALVHPQHSFEANLHVLVAAIAENEVAPPAPRTGEMGVPCFLGLLPTRGCNMACTYCDFPAPKLGSTTMSLATAAAAIDGYLALLDDLGQRHVEIQFFGGEPFYAAEVVHFAVDYARDRAAAQGYSSRFEATTNGLYSQQRCQWIADTFDAIVLSLDGPPEVQDRNRPALLGRSASGVVMRSAQIFSQGPVELILRACVTDDTVQQLPDIARRFAETFLPSAVCFEVLSPTPASEQAGLTPPDPYAFARAFDAAERALEPYGIRAVLSTAELDKRQVTFCPVGRDALIVSPDGAIDACYLPEERWRQPGLDMSLGWVDTGAHRLCIDIDAINRVRRLNVNNKPRCAHCFCRFHCAGGCYVRQPAGKAPGDYDDLCVHTRLVTAARLLRLLGEDALASGWLRDQASLELAARQPDDRLLSLCHER
jgi:uncharacterized protein